MKISSERAESFCANPGETVRVVLVYGPDEGLVRERSLRLVASAVEDPADPFRVAELSAARIKADPAVLPDEIAARALTGGRRAIRVRDADDALAALVTAVIEDGKSDALLVLQAGDLGPRSALRKAVEAAPAQAAAVPCYLDAGASIAGMVRDSFAQAGFSIDRDALAYFVGRLGNDRAVTRGETEKLLTYMGAGVPGFEPRSAALEDAAACSGDMSALSMDDMVLALADGDDGATQRLLDRLLDEGQAGVRLARAASAHFMRLHLVVGALNQGYGVDEALRLLKPPLFWKARDRFLAQARRWRGDKLSLALEILLQTELDCKTTGMPEAETASRAFLHICRLARSTQPPGA